jgi:hypothetical protein
MDSLDHNPAGSDADPSAIVDRSVTYVMMGLASLLAFALILSTFLQVNRFTQKTTHTVPDEPVQPVIRQAEIGGIPPSDSSP